MLSFVCATPVAGETLIVDSTKSFLQLEVLIFDLPVATPQLLGSDRSAIAGTLEATIVGNQITFDGGSVLDFQEFDDGNTDLLPDVGGGSPGNPGTGAPADIGMDLLLQGLGTGVAAVRMGVADLSGGPETITAGEFDASNLTLSLTAGNLDANLSTSLGDIVESVDISGNTAINVNGGNGTTEIVDGLRVVDIPIDLEVVLEVEISDGVFLPIQAVFTGRVATIPEPSSLALAGVACVALSWFGYRRSRRRAS